MDTFGDNERENWTRNYNTDRKYKKFCEKIVKSFCKL